jgi:hypothetical protein
MATTYTGSDGRRWESKIIDPRDADKYRADGWAPIDDPMRGPGPVDDDPRLLWHDRRMIIRRALADGGQ